MARFQQGSLRREVRAAGATWVLRFNTDRPEDGRRVEHTIAVGLVSEYPSESAAWAEVNRLRLHEQINKPEFKGPNDRAGRYADGVFRAVNSGGPVAITGELRVSLFL